MIILHSLSLPPSNLLILFHKKKYEHFNESIRLSYSLLKIIITFLGQLMGLIMLWSCYACNAHAMTQPNQVMGCVGNDGYYVAYKPITLSCIFFMFIEMKFIHCHSCVIFAMKSMSICND